MAVLATNLPKPSRNSPRARPVEPPMAFPDLREHARVDAAEPAFCYRLESQALPVMLLLLLCTPCHCAEGLKDRDPAQDSQRAGLESVLTGCRDPFILIFFCLSHTKSLLDRLRSMLNKDLRHLHSPYHPIPMPCRHRSTMFYPFFLACCLLSPILKDHLNVWQRARSPHRAACPGCAPASTSRCSPHCAAGPRSGPGAC